MPVLDSRIWVHQFVEACKIQRRQDPYFLQCEALCSPLQELFPALSPEELHYHLLTYGLFEPAEWKGIQRTVQKMENNNIWELVDQEYKRLKKKWRGPEAAVIIFPIRRSRSVKKRIRKNGAAFKTAIFLFLSPGLQEEEIKSLLAHEYNHLCRLAYLGKEETDLCLKDVLILEGLGEFAVKELYGKKWLAPWTRLYTFEEASAIWKSIFIPSLTIEGKEHYHEFLYGSTGGPLPKWIGYSIGFQIVDSFYLSHGPFENEELYKKTADELIAGSNFRY
ncbi:DUF2268 domain-containing protein [Domibacillus iocasae]|uniref:DUF2268 domain-containing protein n=1 Tax=Domibacillus iocasae TaxID=1714016 RepID=A0A1E7DUF9_9BACI|nr:DUF2268 domain-containing putative Zn-dependent protease [Domibacillus iocasae]OES46720.1 hypothetical protein BA724_01275 [Domibacillus iocasae]